MKRYYKVTELEKSLKPLIRGLGFDVVELAMHRNRFGIYVIIVLYRSEGISVEDCALVYKTVLPKIEILEDTRDVHLEIASPGIDRNLKTAHEFAIFKGKGVKVLKDDDTEWTYGVIHEASDHDVTIMKDDKVLSLSFESIRKARLDYSQEVK